MPAGPVLHLSLPVRDLPEARSFYESVLGCRVGRVRDDWVDVWFFGLQLTLQERPGETVPAEGQGVRHFGVAFSDRGEFDRLVDRVHMSGCSWLTEPELHSDARLNGKVAGKFADPSGNVIEIKYYAEPATYLA